jgi:hypothetical protein
MRRSLGFAGELAAQQGVPGGEEQAWEAQEWQAHLQKDYSSSSIR